MESQSTLTLPKVYLVSHDDQHRGDIGSFASKYFHLTTFEDAYAVLGALENDRPDAIIAENDVPPKGGLRMLISQSSGVPGPPISFVVTADKGQGFDVPRDDIRGAARFLNWPFSGKLLLDSVSDVISEAAERDWEELPEVQAKTLKMTVEEYHKVTDAIANGEPIQYDEAAVSCAPLVDAVQAGTTHDLLNSVRSHHNYTYVHSMRVATLLTMFGDGIGMKGTDMLILSTGGLLHDVGKLVTPEEILDKPGKLTEEEWPTMKDHVVKSGTLLDAGDDVTKGALIIAKQHHEKIDGTGYPLGLKGSEMNELARMSSICDIFGALTDARSYKPAFPPEKAFAILEDMGPAIDQGLLAVFKQIFDPGTVH